MRTLTTILVFVLSGMPAAAVVCDLVVCPRQSSAPLRAGCHEHATTGDGTQLSAARGACAHLSVVDPFVPASPRHALSLVAALVAPIAGAVTAVSALPVPAWRSHRPPTRSRQSQPTPLRI